MQVMSIDVHALELVLLQAPGATGNPVRHDLRYTATAPPRAFALLVVRLPSDSGTGSVTVQREGRTLACAGLQDAFAATYAAAYTDCASWVACAAQGHAAFVVYALCAAQVCAWLNRSALPLARTSLRERA
jgi:hypothetical protein